MSVTVLKMSAVVEKFESARVNATVQMFFWL